MEEPLSPASTAIALGVPGIRIEILRALAAGPATISRLGALVGCTRNGLESHLAALEQIGAIHHETMRVRGSFRPARVFRLEPARVEEIAWMIFDALVDEKADAEGAA